jgi:hypothetical protein
MYVESCGLRATRRVVFFFAEVADRLKLYRRKIMEALKVGFGPSTYRNALRFLAHWATAKCGCGTNVLVRAIFLYACRA